MKSSVREDNIDLGLPPFADVAGLEAHVVAGIRGRLGEHRWRGVDSCSPGRSQLPMQRGGQATVAAAQIDHQGRRRRFKKGGQIPERLFPLSGESVVLGWVPGRRHHGLLAGSWRDLDVDIGYAITEERVKTSS